PVGTARPDRGGARALGARDRRVQRRGLARAGGSPRPYGRSETALNARQYLAGSRSVKLHVVERRNLVLAAMIVAVSMTFIDQTIVSISAPQIAEHLGLSSTGVQWVINAYLLTLASLFAFGG